MSEIIEHRIWALEPIQTLTTGYGASYGGFQGVANRADVYKSVKLLEILN